MPHNLHLHLLPDQDSEQPAYTDDQRDSAAGGEVMMILRGYYPDAASSSDQHDSLQAQLCHAAQVAARQHHQDCPIPDVQARLAAIEVKMARLVAEREVLWEAKLAGCTEAGW